VIVLDAGAKIAEGPPERVATNNMVLEAYLGRSKSVDRKRVRALTLSPTPVLRAEDVWAGYGTATVLRDVTLHVNDGEVVAVIGANGAGKTTLTRVLTGLLQPTTGDIWLLGEKIHCLRANRIAARGLVLVPEGRQVFPELSVIDNIRLGGFAHGVRDQARLLNALLTRFERLRERSDQRAGSLSGGEQQMLAIARGLMAKPRVLMLDEPSLGLAPKMLDELYELLAELRDEGTTILLVDQMAVLALSVADRAYVFQGGTVKHSGNAAEIGRDPALVRAYLGAQDLRYDLSM
jgi:ABC-type branched-subunit amino acid transport system ATPase component